MNLKEETLATIIGSGHSEEDVMFIGSEDGKYRMSMETFKEKADFEYDAGYGAQEVAQDLIIYFKDRSYITRSDYDGAEGWEYNEPKRFTNEDKYEDFETLSVVGTDQCGWCSVEKLNKSGN